MRGTTRDALFVVAAGVVAALTWGAAACRSKPEPKYSELVQQQVRQLETTLRNVIPDIDRAQVAISVMSEISRVEALYVSRTVTASAELDALNRDYDATPEQFQAVYDRVLATRHELRQEILPRVQELQGMLLDVEWKTLHREMGELDSSWKGLVQ